jgi:hypothetical protein
MGKSRRDNARFEVKRIRRAFNKLYRKGRGLPNEEFLHVKLENMARESEEDKRLAELKRQGGMGTHKKSDYNRPRRNIFSRSPAFRKMLYTGEYNDKERDTTTEIIDEG